METAGIVKLKLVTTKSEDKRDLYITSDRDNNYFLAYQDENSGIEIRVGTSTGSKYRPIYASELVEKLRDNKWLHNKNLSIDVEGNIIYCLDSDGLDRTYPTYEISLGKLSSFPLTNKDTISEYQFEEVWSNLFKDLPSGSTEIKTEIENMAKSKEIYLFNDSSEEIDFLNTSNSATLIEYNSGVYTNSLDLKGILSGKICESDITTLKVDLSVQYSNSSGLVFNHDTTFEGLAVENGKITLSNFIEEVGSDITIEYLNGIIRVFPERDEIIECIISNCSVTYGNLK